MERQTAELSEPKASFRLSRNELRATVAGHSKRRQAPVQLPPLSMFSKTTRGQNIVLYKTDCHAAQGARNDREFIERFHEGYWMPACAGMTAMTAIPDITIQSVRGNDKKERPGIFFFQAFCY